MNDIYVKIIFDKPSAEQDELYDWDQMVSSLYTFPFTGFEEGNQLIGYILSSDFEPIRKTFESHCAHHNWTYQIELMEDQNWNEKWEEEYEMVQVDDFCCIVAPFHDPPDHVQFTIQINPEMSFGTGHHQTTHMMIQQMQHIDFAGKYVLDYGCGTGVLAILADHLGAFKTDAIDYDIWSFRNSAQNCQINNCKQINVMHGDLRIVEHLTYDIILANINRHVLLSSMKTMSQLLKFQGQVLLSGLLEQDREFISNAYRSAGFSLVKEHKKDDWISLLLLKNVKS